MVHNGGDREIGTAIPCIIPSEIFKCLISGSVLAFYRVRDGGCLVENTASRGPAHPGMVLYTIRRIVRPKSSDLTEATGGARVQVATGDRNGVHQTLIPCDMAARFHGRAGSD